METSCVLSGGGVVVYPTETVYGLGGNARDETVVKKIFEIKGREEGKPMIVLVKDFKMAKDIANLGNYELLLRKYWPGALTGVFKAAINLPDGVVSKEGTVAVRVSPHPFVRNLFEYISFPLISTSANRSGDKNSLTISEVKKSLGAKTNLIDSFVDWGKLYTSIPSTIVSFISGVPKVLRQGSIIFL